MHSYILENIECETFILTGQKYNDFRGGEEGGRGRVDWGPVDPATNQATKIACGVRTWIEDVQFFQK